MKPQYKEQLLQLRQQMPIPLSEAQKLLQQTAGNVESAITLYKTQCKEQLSEQTRRTQQEVEAILLAKAYDKEQALLALQQKEYEQSTTLSQRILNKYKDNDTAFSRIAIAIEHTDSIAPEYIFRTSALLHLNTSRYIFMRIYWWLAYVEVEGFDYALEYYIEEISEMIEQTLALPHIRQLLHLAAERTQQIKAANQQHEATNALHKDMLFLSYKDTYFTEQPRILAALREYIVKNIGEFP